MTTCISTNLRRLVVEDTINSSCSEEVYVIYMFVNVVDSKIMA